MSLEAAKKDIEKLLSDFCSENGTHEPDTNAFIFFNPYAAEYANGLEEAIEIIDRHLENQ